jgi:hypothetical protein
VTAHRLAGAAVGVRSRAMLSLVPAKSFQSKSFRLPLAAESLSLCVAKEKVTKEKGHPAYAPCGHPARKVRGRATGFFDSTSCAGEKLAGFHAGHPAGFPSPARRFRGAPGRAAGHPGPHSSKELQQQPRQQPQQGNSSTWLCSAAFAFAFQLHHRVRARMARCSTRGPLRGGETGPTGRAAGVARDGNAFSRGQDARSKSPAPAHGLAGQEPGKRQAGWPFSLVTFSLATQRESDSVAEGDRPLLILNVARARASRTRCAPTGAGGRKRFANRFANRNAGGRA